MDPPVGVMALVLPNCKPDAEALIYKNLPPRVRDEMLAHGLSGAIPASLFAQVTREVVEEAVSTGKILRDDATNTWYATTGA